MTKLTLLVLIAAAGCVHGPTQPADAPLSLSVGPGCTWRKEWTNQQTGLVEVRQNIWYRVCPTEKPAPLDGVLVIPDSTWTRPR